MQSLIFSHTDECVCMCDRLFCDCALTSVYVLSILYTCIVCHNYYYPLFRGEVKSECWLVLTDSSLQCHDRHPAGVTRKPLVCFSWTDPQSLVVVVRNVDSRPISYVSSTKHQHLMFAVEQHSAAEGVKRGVFITEALEEKEEWIVAIESAIMRSSGVVDSSSSTESSAAAASLRSGVTVTPVSRTQRLARKRSRPASTPCTTSSPDSSVI